MRHCVSRNGVRGIGEDYRQKVVASDLDANLRVVPDDNGHLLRAAVERRGRLESAMGALRVLGDLCAGIRARFESYPSRIHR